MMSESYSRSLARQYWVIALLAMLTCVFHATVSHKFGQMMAGMQEAALLKRTLRMEELEMFNEYRESMVLHLASRRNVRNAYAKEHEAVELLHRIKSEETEASRVHDDASELENEANEDEAKAADLDYASISDNLDYIASKLRGTSIEQRAQHEAAEASGLLAHADELEEQGAQLLKEAEAQLNATENATEVVKSNHGLCKWVSWACRGIDNHVPTVPKKKMSDEAIAVASSFDKALESIDNAKKERDRAMKLLHKSAEDMNESIALLKNASEFQERSNEEHLEASELLKEAKADKEKATQEEIVENFEDEEIETDKGKLISSLNAMSRFAVEAREEAENATALDYRRQTEHATVMETELQIRNVTYAAKKHVAHAGWYAVLAALLAVGLFVLCVIRIMTACLKKEPWTWVVRNQQFVVRDVSYVYVHFLLLLLTMAFSGDLLRNFHNHGNLGRIETTALFALAGSFFQVALLHLIPNIIRLVSVSSLSVHTFLTLFRENVAKSGAIVFAVFIMEILLCWVNFGDLMFSRIYKLNNPWFWMFVVVAGAIHICCVEKYSPIPVETESRLEDSEISSMTTPEADQGTEMHSFSERPATQEDGVSTHSWRSVDLRTPSPSLSGNVHTRYGSTAMKERSRSLSPEISSTFISSWALQVTQLSLLLDLLLASWAVWILRHNVAIIFKLSPISPGVVWGLFPLWVLDVFIALVLAVASAAFFRWRQQKQHEVQNLRRQGEISSAPLLG